MKNKGKIFEEAFRDSIDKERIVLFRLNDQPQSFAKTAKFSLKNPFDYICFDTKSKTLFCLELKSTKGKSISYEDINSENIQNEMIHKHQILGLMEKGEYDNVVAGFIFNFRHFEGDKEKYFETTYFQDINSFLEMTKKINKKSFNELDLLTCGNAVKINGEKKRTRFRWNFNEFFQNISNKE